VEEPNEGLTHLKRNGKIINGESICQGTPQNKRLTVEEYVEMEKQKNKAGSQ